MRPRLTIEEGNVEKTKETKTEETKANRSDQGG